MTVDTTGDVRPATSYDIHDFAFALYVAGPEAIAAYLDPERIDQDLINLLPMMKQKGVADLEPPLRRIYARIHRYSLARIRRLGIVQPDNPLADGRGDSPIEVAFFTALMIEAQFGDFAFEKVIVPPRGSRWMVDAQNVLCVESQVDILEFRIDFRVSVLDPSESKKELVVECDGHAFHDRTKEQASKDRARDRLLQMQGLTVFRFTGADIWRNPCACADQVMQWAAAASKGFEVQNG